MSGAARQCRELDPPPAPVADGGTRQRVTVTRLHQWRLWLSGVIGSRYDGLTHFRVVEPGALLRCGQPRLGDLEWIRTTHGLRTVVCARGGTRHPLRGRWFRRERRWCQAAGVAFVHLPFSDAAEPPCAVFERFLSAVSDARQQPVLVHCEQGFHRSGVLCAAFRVRVQRWPLPRALAEMEELGFELHRDKRRPLLRSLQDWLAVTSSTASPPALDGLPVQESG